MRLRITHETRLAFPKPVREHHCELRLAPREGETQRRLSCRIDQQVDVGAGIELGSPVAALGDQRDPLVEDRVSLGIARTGGLVEGQHDAVNHRRPFGDDSGAGRPRPVALEEQFLGPGEVVAGLTAPSAVQQERPERIEHGLGRQGRRRGSSRQHRRGYTPDGARGAQAPFGSLFRN